jgi:murein L,D-transpeptidase YcbB/YkuD
MKKIFAFGIAVAASLALLQAAEAGSRSSAHSFSSAPHFSAPAHHYAGPSRSFSSGGARFNGPARFSSGQSFHSRIYAPTGPRFSSSTALRNPAYFSNRTRFPGNRTTAFNSPSYSAAGPRLAAGVRTQGINNRERVVARYSANWQRHWDRGRDHFWHGHRCRFQNGFWFICDPFFYPYEYGYGYYPYGAYYDDTYYDDSYAPTEYSPAPYTNQPENGTGSRVSEVQSALAREGYYDGPIDGRLGNATRKALRRYQSDHGLDATGAINRAVIEALQLR